MTFGFSTPLLDVIRRGEADRDVRMMAAAAVLAPRATEQIALLALLAGDSDPDVAATAERTIATIPSNDLAACLASTDASDQVRRFFEERGVVPGTAPDEERDGPLVEAPTELSAVDDKSEKAPQLVSMLPILERMKLAMRGTREQRAILIRDPHKMVALAVLSSPKLTENEVETFARMGNVSEEVLRVIARTRAWMKNYAIMSALTRNPKTPPALSLRLVPQLNARDVRMLSLDRNVPEGLRIAARKFLSAAESRRS